VALVFANLGGRALLAPAGFDAPDAPPGSR
jgi:hypothetical protein